MKVTFAIFSLIIGTLTGCVTYFPMGSIYTDVSLPVEATGAAGRALAC